jgi:hypothetical protein
MRMLVAIALGALASKVASSLGLHGTPVHAGLGSAFATIGLLWQFHRRGGR